MTAPYLGRLPCEKLVLKLSSVNAFGFVNVPPLLSDEMMKTFVGGALKPSW